MLDSVVLFKVSISIYRFWLEDASALEFLVHVPGSLYTNITLSFKINLRDMYFFVSIRNV